MRRNKGIFCIVIGLFIIFAIILFVVCSLHRENNVFRGIEIERSHNMSYVNVEQHEEVLLNPGKGWVLQHISTNDIELQDIVSVGYMRYNWSTIEPVEGRYNWKIIDNAIKSYSEAGKKFAFGVMCANTSDHIKYITPKWVFDAGARYDEKYIEDLGNIQVIPVWTDEIFLEKLSRFVQELGKRYDGNPNIAYIDIRSYGNWGEQHLGKIGGTDLTGEQLKDLYISTYQNAFKSTLLVNPWGGMRYYDIYNWAVNKGISIRRDGIFQSNTDGSECLMAYGKLPTIFEYVRPYSVLKQNNLWNQKNLLEYVENGKPSYMQISKDMYYENKEFCDMLANKMGYYFKFKGATYKNSVTTKEQNQIKLNFVNEGVAPLYEPCTVYIGLLDQNYHLVKKYKTDINPHTWMPNEEVQENIKLQLADVEDGRYIISLGLFLNEEDDQPTYLLGNSGKTDDKWYVFGEIDITNTQEEYKLETEDNSTIVNTYNGYKIHVQADNLKAESNYVVKVYDSNNLVRELSIDHRQENYSSNISLELVDGNHILTIQIEKDGIIVHQLKKNIYVSNFERDYRAISDKATKKYTEFQNQFRNEITKVNGMTDKLSELKKYMQNISKATSIKEASSIIAMKDHYNLGNMLIQAVREKQLDIEFVTLSSMLDMLDEIGNSYEDLVTVTATTRAPNLVQTKAKIDEAERLINANSDLDIVYPSKILDFSKDYYDKSDYINHLEEENDIKTGLIMSKHLHSDLLAEWSKEFVNLYIDKYIESNPVKVSYSETDYTNENVVVTLQSNADITIINNNSSKEYTFTQNGKFTFEYRIKDRQYCIEAKVSNIDKTLPVISGVENNRLYTNGVTPKISDENLSKVTLIQNGQVVESYKINSEISEEGIYTLTANDKAGNTTSVRFQILENVDDSYKVEDNYIKNITNNTTKTRFEEKLKLGVEYEIIRKDEILPEDSIIATGDVLKTASGHEYILIVAGDINNDGNVNIKDIVKMRKYLLYRNTLDEIQLMAADSNVDGKTVGIKDLVRMRILALTKTTTK